MREIATCPDGRLAEVLADAEPGLRVGLCAVLEVRPNPVEPSLAVCVALLASHDPPEQVARQFQRFAANTPEFLGGIDAEMIEHRKRIGVEMLVAVDFGRWRNVGGRVAARGIGDAAVAA